MTALSNNRKLANRATQTVYVEDFGASESASAAENFAAINSALNAIYEKGGGTLEFNGMYDIGNNILQLADSGNFGLYSVLTLKGNVCPSDVRKQTSVSSQVINHGITGSASKIIEVGTSTAAFSAALRLEKFAVHGQTTNQIGIDFENPFPADPYVQCDMESVSVINFEGPNAICINAEKCVDSNWRNVSVAGINTQAGIGIRVNGDNLKISDSTIWYCRTGVWISNSATHNIDAVNTSIIFCDDYGVYFEPGATGSKRGVSSWVNCFIGENNNGTTAEDSIPVYNLDTQAIMTLTGCTLERSNNTSNPVVFWKEGNINLIGCVNVKGGNNTSGTDDIDIGADGTLTMIGCKHFTSVDYAAGDQTGVVIQGNFNYNGEQAQSNAILSGLEVLRGQVKFNQTYRVPSADPNTLDDYKEGNSGSDWTPVFKEDNTTTVTMTLTESRYTKIGRLVHVVVRAQRNDASALAGDVTFNLPFPSTGNSFGTPSGRCWVPGQATGDVMVDNIADGICNVLQSASGGTNNYLDWSTVGDGEQIRLNFTYESE